MSTPEDTIAIEQRSIAIARMAWEAVAGSEPWDSIDPDVRSILIECAHQGLLAGMNARGRE